MRWIGRGKQHVRGSMNKMEEQYGNDLELRVKCGELLWYRFEAIKLRLADNTFYTPDYLVLTKDQELEVHEVKGHWEDDSRVKIKVAAETFPFRFIAITALPKKEGGGWKIEEF